MNTQRIASLARQFAALAAVVVGALSSPLILNVLPAGVSTALVVVGGALFGIEHHHSATSAQNGSGGPQTSGVVPTTGEATSTSAPPTIPPTKA